MFWEGSLQAWIWRAIRPSQGWCYMTAHENTKLSIIHGSIAMANATRGQVLFVLRVIIGKGSELHLEWNLSGLPEKRYKPQSWPNMVLLDQTRVRESVQVHRFLCKLKIILGLSHAWKIYMMGFAFIFVIHVVMRLELQFRGCRCRTRISTTWLELRH